jgi:hypothetical protein
VGPAIFTPESTTEFSIGGKRGALVDSGKLRRRLAPGEVRERAGRALNIQKAGSELEAVTRTLAQALDRRSPGCIIPNGYPIYLEADRC